MSRIRVRAGERELEVEGDTDFISSYSQPIRSMLDLLVQPTNTVETAAPSSVSQAQPQVAEHFGEFLNRLPKSVTGNDQMLAAAWWTQDRSEDKTFTTGEAAGLLEEQGVKLPNPSSAVARNRAARHVFAVEKGRFRVSKQGADHLRLLTESIESK